MAQAVFVDPLVRLCWGWGARWASPQAPGWHMHALAEAVVWPRWASLWAPVRMHRCRQCPQQDRWPGPGLLVGHMGQSISLLEVGNDLRQPVLSLWGANTSAPCVLGATSLMCWTTYSWGVESCMSMGASDIHTTRSSHHHDAAALCADVRVYWWRPRDVEIQ